MTTSFIPWFDRVIVKRDNYSTKSKIILPDNLKDKKTYTGIILSVGAGCCDLAKDSIGQRVAFAQYSGALIKTDPNVESTDEIFVIQDRDIIGRFSDDGELFEDEKFIYDREIGNE